MPEPLENLAPPPRENLEGYVPSLGSERELRDALEKALCYRGDITLRTRGGTVITGSLFDRSAESADLGQCHIRVLTSADARRLSIRYGDIVHLEFTGKDAAAGKSFQTWLKKCEEKKAAGEKNIRIEPEPLV